MLNENNVWLGYSLILCIHCLFGDANKTGLIQLVLLRRSWDGRPSPKQYLIAALRHTAYQNLADLQATIGESEEYPRLAQ